jgi:DNA-binding NtrC family response regulator
MLAAQADTAPVLIHGGSGTGKGAIAQWIHQNGPRAAFPLIEAKRARDIALLSQLPAAQGGSIIIPEVSDYSLSEQKALLSFLKTRSIPHPERDGLPLLLNVRVIATTSHLLEGRTQGGLFNPELFQALSVFRLEMPALAQRTDEFADIAQGIAGEIIRELHKEHIRGISEDALARLSAYDWPGNVRELRNVLRVGLIGAEGDRLELADLPDFGHEHIDFRATREQFEKIYLLELLKTFDNQVDRASLAARMDLKQMLEKIERYGIKLEPAQTGLGI